MRVLHLRFPQAMGIVMDASQARHYDLFPGATVGPWSGGLPLLSMSPRKGCRFCRGLSATFRPAGSFFNLPMSALSGGRAPSSTGSDSRARALEGRSAIFPAAVYRHHPPSALAMPAASSIRDARPA